MKSTCRLLLLMVYIVSASCVSKKSNLEAADVGQLEEQYEYLYKSIKDVKESPKPMPRTTKNDKLVNVGPYDWTSGFYPGSLWQLYGLTGNDVWKERATAYTEKLDTIQYWEGNHDVGFIIECSYGNGLKYQDSNAYEEVIVQTAKSLSTRFKPNAGVLQSWEWNKKWDCPVIIDNMMNLELLFHATKISGDSTFYDIAVSHADTTIKNHFRDDGSSFHVVDYNPATGEVIQKNTHQGYSDDSAWARGQAWGLYGYVMVYRETKDPKYLRHAEKIANFIKTHPNLPNDQVPYWDYDVSPGENTLRDASAAAITASALLELSTYDTDTSSKDYLKWGNDIIDSLSSKTYLAKVGTNGGFLLKHSVGSKPHGVELDVPLNYADYYYLEALSRQKQISK
ncbi:glycoside hydrolase family 88 protein [Salegentibacter maritimus]|uniref:Glycoside hydrolase family 88 protein n=1 Tax=Salegentibacter maritimus TaxID=2794347 RepID=A0ABS0TMJ7_9FLAO|nr:glycoside hydrolase family 88 protein [Salegentibacter maritimus]MBI6121254.1 glycoside hydrolase family 88 protein [Salegentibacter maritimus]